MNHHQLDPYPIPKEKDPLYINEPWLLDKTLLEYPSRKEPDENDDNVRIYAPLDRLNSDPVTFQKRCMFRCLPFRRIHFQRIRHCSFTVCAASGAAR